MTSPPTGTVTFLFTDIEGSTALLQRLGDRRYAEVLAEHRRLLRDAFAKGNGHEVDTQGDAFLVAFPRARDALGAAVAAQQALMKHAWPDGASLRVRMGLHTGEPLSGETGYVGIDVHRAARIAAAGHGGQILLSDAVSSLAARDLPPGVSLRDLGSHRLKDLRESERIFQVAHPDLRSEFPPLKSLDALPNNLPRQLTSFIGREREIAEVKRLLSTTCLLTLTGAGGAGKTRLALQVATDLLGHYRDGVWLAQLAPLSEPTLVPKAVATALGIPEQPGRLVTDTVVDYVRPRSPLLILDNCEHLLEACAQLAGVLLQACPNLRMVATSREPLGIAGELTYRVPSLSLPDLKRLPPLEMLTQYEAVRLFTERAAFSKPGFQITNGNAAAIAKVTHRLDGIPLAIELAAARVKALPVDLIAARLDDQFRLLTGGSRTGLPRHQTLRATLDWSYDLLSDDERILLRRLSVFAGGFTLEAAERICVGEGVQEDDVLNLIIRLVDKSLVVFDDGDGQGRYRLLETVRQYGDERLYESGEVNDVRRKHRDWYLALAERSDSDMSRGRQTEAWLTCLETEHDNLRAVLEWSKLDRDGAEAGLRLVGALRWFWFRHDHWSEALTWALAALARSDEARSSVLPKALGSGTHFAWRAGDYGLATTMGQKALALSRELGDNDSSAYALFNLGIIAMRQADYQLAAAHFDDCLNVSAELANKWVYGTTLVQLGILARYQGDDERATAFHTQALAVLRDIGDKWAIAYALHRFGRDVAFHRGDYDRAVACFVESVILCQESGNRWIQEECLEGLARAASATGQWERATRLFGAAEAQREIIGHRFAPPEQAGHDQRVACARVALGDDTFTAAWAEGRAMTLDQAVEYALKPAT